MPLIQTLKLRWTSQEFPPLEQFPWMAHPRPQPRLHLVSGETASSSEDAQGEEAVLTVCGEPRCGCMNMLATFPPTPENPKREFWFDLGERITHLSREQEDHAECARLAGLMRGTLTDEEQQRLREWYLAEKLKTILTTPVSRMDINDLPDADDGRLVGFIEVFPQGLAWYFNLDGATWAVDDSHCVQQDCGCCDAVLAFFKLKDATGARAREVSNPPALRYNYRSQKTKPLKSGPPGAPSLETLLSALKQAHAILLDAQLEQRHLILQSLYVRREVQRSQDRLKSLSAAMPRKVGRNEPCPCGSGRKYKHCCLNKGRS